MDHSDLKEKATTLGFTSAIFLPIRLLLGQYLVDNWFGMLGIVSLISVMLVILVKRKNWAK